MTCSARTTWIRRLSLGALLALWGALAAPAPAQAGCSHYVVSGAHRAEDAVRQELLSISDEWLSAALPPTASDPAAPAQHEPARGGCPGGVCSGDPAAPAAPVPPAPVVENDQWGCLAAPARVLADSSLSLWAETSPRLPLQPADSIDRPPRLISPA